MTIELKPGGLLIAIEGIDGAGKTTLARSLATTLEAAGARVVLSKEPTNGPWGTQLRQSAATGRLSADEEAELLIRDRHEHVDTLIAPALARGDIVILDRYFPSMVAYQGAAGLPLDDLLDRNAFAPRPDVLLLLDLPPPTGLARIRARGDAPNHFETQDNLERCRSIFA
ncbi:MAG: dTMP kinase, partial [Xanthomonas perforans]|nr:dTMP kinase [Xanthomonas perforans]